MINKWKSMRFTLHGWVVLAAVVIAPPVYVLSADAAPVTVVNYYETQCETQARKAHGVPPLTLDQSEGLIGWQREHVNTSEGIAFNAESSECAPTSAFDFDSMVLVHTEVAK
jgi:hypothetical protein